jgi:hypothetical protein
MTNANKYRDKFIKLTSDDEDLSQEELEAQLLALLGPDEYVEIHRDCEAYYDKVELEWKSLEQARAEISECPRPQEFALMMPVSQSFAEKARANPNGVRVSVRDSGGVTSVERPTQIT